ncbi:GNAT family N-acetyltransferase [Cytobacillus purgationiresistens]|nr:GNAT family protein [Cytobacillus purgationiresistens]
MLQSDRIQFRKMVSEDIEMYHKWRNDMDVMMTTSPFLDVYSLAETRDFVEQVILHSSNSKCYIMEAKATSMAIGVVSLINIDAKNQNAECVIDIGEKEYWGKGYGGEALRLLLNYAFLELNLHRVALKVFSFNEKAVHLYKKLGFKQEGWSRENLYRYGKWHDVIHMGILKDEFVEHLSKDNQL